MRSATAFLTCCQSTDTKLQKVDSKAVIDTVKTNAPTGSAAKTYVATTATATVAQETDQAKIEDNLSAISKEAAEEKTKMENEKEAEEKASADAEVELKTEESNSSSGIPSGNDSEELSEALAVLVAPSAVLTGIAIFQALFFAQM